MRLARNAAVIALVTTFAGCLTARPVAAAKPPPPRLVDREEWKLAQRTWQGLSDHAANRINNRHEFALLRVDLDGAKEGLAKLGREKALSPGLAGDLADLFEGRYNYLADNLYPSTATLHLDGAALVKSGASARFEWFLKASQDPPWSGRERARLVPQAKGALIQQLELIRRTREVEAKVAQEEKELREKEAKGEKVDWGRAQVRWSRPVLELVQTFRTGRRVSVSRETNRLADAVFSLSARKLETAPPEPGPASSPPAR